MCTFRTDLFVDMTDRCKSENSDRDGRMTDLSRSRTPPLRIVSIHQWLTAKGA
ncbi:hypothetical protein PILCRDRAFT_794242 [Piloderma croceum F 1598]|uniref:Uncharacterized protein n=1 Tax=Piloderma croceum (strain F 1598) TaxID=765440 RepID=A0A0C3FEH8_PILCF|nr:hypothetical protein PILCRDRAFT_794242 [Piloderma croceum F 1598]